MTKYFQKITGPKFVGLIILWIIVNSILGIFLAVIYKETIIVEPKRKPS